MGVNPSRFSNFMRNTVCQKSSHAPCCFRILADIPTSGPIVRTAPNDVSFSSSQAWRDIYSARKGHQHFIKSEFYDGGNFAAESLSIVSERDPEKHGHMRKYLSSVFSDRSLKEQEYLIAQTVDELVDQLKRHASESNEATDMTMWYNLATFDVSWENI